MCRSLGVPANAFANEFFLCWGGGELDFLNCGYIGECGFGRNENRFSLVFCMEKVKVWKGNNYEIS